MYKVSTATYRNNALSLDEKIDFYEGAKVKVIIIEEKNTKKDNFFNFVKKHTIKIPTNYKFNRDELYDR